MLYHLSVDNLTVFVTVFINKRFLVLRHTSQRHTHAGEASVVIEILHRNLLRQIGEHHHTIVRAFIRTGITQRRHTIAEIIQTIEPLDTAASGSKGRRLGNRIDTDSFLAPINITETTGDGFQQRLCIRYSRRKYVVPPHNSTPK